MSLVTRFRLWRFRRRLNAIYMTMPEWWRAMSDDEQGEYINREIAAHRAARRTT